MYSVFDREHCRNAQMQGSAKHEFSSSFNISRVLEILSYFFFPLIDKNWKNIPLKADITIRPFIFEESISLLGYSAHSFEVFKSSLIEMYLGYTVF